MGQKSSKPTWVQQTQYKAPGSGLSWKTLAFAIGIAILLIFIASLVLGLQIKSMKKTITAQNVAQQSLTSQLNSTNNQLTTQLSTVSSEVTTTRANLQKQLIDQGTDIYNVQNHARYR